MKSLKPQPDLHRSDVLKALEKRLEDEQHKVELAIIESKNAGGNGLEKLWQERDSPAEDEIREVEFTHRASLLGQWRDLEDALQRLKHQAFGLCIDCGKNIPTKRLLANPTVSRCLPCQSGLEGEVSSPSL